MRDVCNELAKVKHKWIQICVQLGFPQHILKQFEDEKDPLSAAVSYWLDGNVAESADPTSWRSIVTVLKSEHVGEPALAERVNEKYCQQNVKRG